MNGAKIIGLALVCIIFTSMEISAQKIWSRKVMSCKNSSCLIDEITWQTNQEYKNKQGYKTGETRHYCKKPDDWIPIIKSILKKDGTHNKILLKKVINGKCYELSFPKKIVLFETVLKGEGWHIKRAQWLYDQPETFYQAFINSNK
mgnify:CR=1 FL=1|jgi:hypothetical protein|tara:strand:+ start:255 stop:692 length:438 start_codon:yes stop_codon:yes gene_type:complete